MAQFRNLNHAGTWKLQRHFTDVIYGSRLGGLFRRNILSLGPSKWTRVNRGWAQDNGDYEPFNWNHGRPHCALCRASESPFHRNRQKFSRR